MRSEIDDIFKEYNETKDEIEITINQTKADLQPFNEKIVLYGAGSAGIAFLNYLRDIDVEPRFFADADEKRWGTLVEGIEVIDYHQIVEKVGEDALVIVTINTDGVRYCKSFAEALRIGGHIGVHKRLAECGCKNVIDYTYFRRCRALFHDDPYNLPSCSDVHHMEKHKEDMQQVYEWLADDKSREVFLKIIRFRMIDDTILIPTDKQDKQYFEYEFYPKRDDEIFVDCGAFNGISLRTFLAENTNMFSRYYGFEPDSVNYVSLQKYVASLPQELHEKIQIFHKAVYDTDAETMIYALHGPGSFVADIGNEAVQTIRIDTAIYDHKASYIKMNIEGSELNALKGAEKTINYSHPKLAIAGYHKTWDLWEVPKLIHTIDPSYKFYLRSYMNHLSFVYYAI